MDSKADQLIRQQLVRHLKGGQAFSPIGKVVDEMPFEKIGVIPDGLPYSFYQLFYHIRVAQADLLEYCRDDNYQAPEWPADYWPDDPSPADKGEWESLIKSYKNERQEFCDLLLSSQTDLLEPFPSNEDHNILRQSELIIEHTAYHTGQLYLIYRLLNQ